jgi:hypothetical protein
MTVRWQLLHYIISQHQWKHLCDSLAEGTQEITAFMLHRNVSVRFGTTGTWKTKLNFFSECVRFHKRIYSVDSKRITLPLYSVLLLYYKGTKLTVKVYVLFKNLFSSNEHLRFKKPDSLLTVCIALPPEECFWTVFNRRNLCIIVKFHVPLISISNCVLIYITHRRHRKIFIRNII